MGMHMGTERIFVCCAMADKAGVQMFYDYAKVHVKAGDGGNGIVAWRREKYVPMGFHHFKIEGRTASIFSLLETYCHYLIKPEYQGETRILLLNNLKSNRIITVNHPKPAVWKPE